MMPSRPSPATRACPSPASKKGQYFSVDAIIASFIFVMALSLLTAQWFSLRAQEGAQSVSLLDDASRISDLLLVPGNPGNWYSPSLRSPRISAGFGLNGTRGGTLNQTTLILAQSAINDPHLTIYAESQQLMALPADYYITFDNLTSLNMGAPLYPSHDFPNISMGREPAQATERVQVYRDVLIPSVDASTTPPHTYYYYGIMTVTVWTNKSST